jgi:hypothetical protein
MPGYRCYFLDHEGKIRAVEAFDADDDAAAEARARALLADARGRYPAIELWQQRRRVLLYPPKS